MRRRVQGAGGQDDFDIDTVELNPAILAALAIILRVDTAIDPMRVRCFSSSSFSFSSCPLPRCLELEDEYDIGRRG